MNAVQIKKRETWDRAHLSGEVAAKRGKPRTANPYKAETNMWDGWNRGWDWYHEWEKSKAFYNRFGEIKAAQSDSHVSAEVQEQD